MPIGELATLIAVLAVLAAAVRQIRRGGARAWIGVLLTVLLLVPYIGGGVLLLTLATGGEAAASDGTALFVLAGFLIYLIAGLIPVTKVAKRIQMRYLPPGR